jgi:hypothetical protein
VPLGEDELLTIVVERAQIDVRGRVCGIDFEHLMIGGERLGLGRGILFERNAASEPSCALSFARSGLVPWDRRAGDNFFSLRKIHEELAGNRLEQLAIVAEGYAMLASRPRTGFAQRLLDARGLFAHGIERLANNGWTNVHGAEIANLFDFQQVRERIGLGRSCQTNALPVGQLARRDTKNA